MHHNRMLEPDPATVIPRNFADHPPLKHSGTPPPTPARPRRVVRVAQESVEVLFRVWSGPVSGPSRAQGKAGSLTHSL